MVQRFRDARPIVITDAAGLPIGSENGGLKVTTNGSVVDTDNSSSTPLGVDGIFTGDWVDVLSFSAVIVSVYSDETSAVDGLEIQWSSDGITQHDSDCYNIPLGIGKTFNFQPSWRYCRVVYTNGDTEQTLFELQTQLKKMAVRGSSHRIQDIITEDDDAELMKAVLTAKDPDRIFVNIQATKSENLRVANAEDGLAIAKGDVTGTSFVHKFGQVPDFDIADGFVNVWDGADDSGIDEMVYTYSTSAIIDSISSSSASDTGDILIQGLDENYTPVSQTITLTGQTRAALTTSLIRAFRMVNVGSADAVGSIYVYENTALSSGTPIDTTKIRALINNGNNQTLMAIYTIPAGKTGYLRDWYASSANSVGVTGGASTIKLAARPFGQVFQLKHISAIFTNGASHIQHKYEEPEVFTEKTDIHMLTNTTVNGSAVSAGFDIVLVDN